jgi:hypothetical protein
MACEEIGDRLMAYIDGELAEEERGRMDRHVAECAECRDALRAYQRVREMARALRFRVPPPEFWDEYPQGVFDRVGRGFGWILIIGFGAILSLYGLVRMWISSDPPLVVKVCVTGLLVGFGVLLVTVIRRRLREAKTDPYKEIIR